MRVCVTAAVFHSRVVYGFSNKDYGYCASARRPSDGTFNRDVGMSRIEREEEQKDAYTHPYIFVFFNDP